MFKSSTIQATGSPYDMIDYPNTTSITTICNYCKTNLAEIFQESGDYCLCCWQEITCPEV